MGHLVQVAVYLTEEENTHLEEISKALHQPKSKVVRLLVKHFLDQDEPVKYIFERCFCEISKKR